MIRSGAADPVPVIMALILVVFSTGIDTPNDVFNLFPSAAHLFRGFKVAMLDVENKKCKVSHIIMSGQCHHVLAGEPSPAQT